MAVIRPFQLGDEHGIAVAHARSIKEICAKDYNPQQIAAWTARIAPAIYLDSITKYGERFWVIDDSGTIGGFAGWRGQNIMGFYVHPEFAGRGLARQLFHAIEAEFWAQSGSTLCQIESTLTAKSFYEKMGFAPIRPDTHRFPNGVVVDIWHMHKTRPV